METQPPPANAINDIDSVIRRGAAGRTSLAWVRYCYGFDLNFRYQTLMCQHVWTE
jgi:nitroimidazol reductase NimA-like FMN-containing flavoprotein (pyridoxamine 5'-phosphate oxidase superfamily)